MYICNKSILFGIFPSRLQFSEIMPLNKKGDRADINIFRPVSLHTTISKILDKVICTRLYQHISENNVLKTNNIASEIIELKKPPSY